LDDVLELFAEPSDDACVDVAFDGTDEAASELAADVESVDEETFDNELFEVGSFDGICVEDAASDSKSFELFDRPLLD
jgi:hypothetical protein